TTDVSLEVTGATPTLFGTTTQAASRRLATLVALLLQRAVTYTLDATSSPVLTGDTSDSFDITAATATATTVETAANGSGSHVSEIGRASCREKCRSARERDP